jgi:hypothetical protein
MDRAGHALDVAPALKRPACVLIVRPPEEFKWLKDFCRGTVAYFPFPSTREIGGQIIDFAANYETLPCGGGRSGLLFPVFSRLCGKIAA